MRSASTIVTPPAQFTFASTWSIVLQSIRPRTHWAVTRASAMVTLLLWLASPWGKAPGVLVTVGVAVTVGVDVLVKVAVAVGVKVGVPLTVAVGVGVAGLVG